MPQYPGREGYEIFRPQFFSRTESQNSTGLRQNTPQYYDDRIVHIKPKHRESSRSQYGDSYAKVKYEDDERYYGDSPRYYSMHNTGTTQYRDQQTITLSNPREHSRTRLFDHPSSSGQVVLSPGRYYGTAEPSARDDRPYHDEVGQCDQRSKHEKARDARELVSLQADPKGRGFFRESNGGYDRGDNVGRYSYGRR